MGGLDCIELHTNISDGISIPNGRENLISTCIIQMAGKTCIIQINQKLINCSVQPQHHYSQNLLTL